MKSHFAADMHSAKKIRWLSKPVSCYLPKQAWIFFFFIGGWACNKIRQKGSEYNIKVRFIQG